jgi:hypothetical protein
MWIMERLGSWGFLPEPALAATGRTMMRMKPLLLAATFLLSACGGGGEGDGNKASSAKAASSGSSPTGPIGAGDSLTGLYEAKSGGLSSQLCIVQRGGGEARFGMNLWGGNMHSCSGAGTAVRAGQQLTLTMAGDRACTITARIDGNAIRLPDSVPEGCSYYCGKNAKMTGVSLARTGTTETDALKARDVVDEPLCDAAKAG